MSKSPPIPPAQRSFHGPRANPALREDEEHAHGAEGGADKGRDRGRSPVTQSAKSVARKSQGR